MQFEILWPAGAAAETRVPATASVRFGRRAVRLRSFFSGLSRPPLVVYLHPQAQGPADGVGRVPAVAAPVSAEHLRTHPPRRRVSGLPLGAVPVLCGQRGPHLEV